MSAPSPAAGRPPAPLPSARAYRAAAVVAPVTALLTLVPQQLLFGHGPHAGLIDRSVFAAPWAIPRPLLILVFAASILLHEALHAVGYVAFGRVPLRKLELGVRWTHLLVYVRCRVPVKRGAFFASLLLPAVALGVVPAVAGLALGRGWLTFYGFILVVVASGDLHSAWVLLRARRARALAATARAAGERGGRATPA